RFSLVNQPTLSMNLKDEAKEYLVFSSVGNHHFIEKWFSGIGNFDTCIAFYGEGLSPYESRASYHIYMKGGKFPNLKYIYDRWPEIFRKYKAVWVADDDISLSPTSIDSLFSF